MKTIFTVFFTLIILLNLGGKTLVYVNFYINQDYITENFCENKDQPILKCNGKCHLAKELAKEEKKEEKHHKQKVQDRTVFFLLPLEVNDQQNFVFIEKTAHMNLRVQSQGAGFYSKIFRPPILS